MEKWKVILFLLVLLAAVHEARARRLKKDFHKSSCPTVESIVTKAVAQKFQQTFVTAQATLRLFFHDCLVEGCDASIMIVSPNGDAERDAPDNLSLAGDGFDTVIKAKQAVEAVCPGVVSCADILALAARDAVVLTGGPFYSVELGRRDGLISKESRVKGHLPDADYDLKRLQGMFSKHNLNQIDLVALSGAHSIGVSHCSHFAKRLYNFSHSNPVDPTLNPDYAAQLMLVCPPNVDLNTVVAFDPASPRTFDNFYYRNLIQGKGLLTSDEVLFTNPKTRPIVKAFAGNMSEFNSAFVMAMTKLGRVGVKTSKRRGDIRTDCTMFNR